MTSNAVAVANANANDRQEADDSMKRTLMILEHKIRNLEKRKLKLEGYLQQRNGTLLSGDQLLAASKFNEVITTLNFARNFKNQLSNLLSTKPKKHNMDTEKHLTNVDDKIKEVLIFQNILENIKDENVKKDLLTGNNGAVQLTDIELSKLYHFSKLVSPKRRVANGKPVFEDQLTTVSKHYNKLIDSNPNIVVGTSYANLKDCLLKIEKSGYLDYITVDKEVKTTNKINSLDTETPQVVHQPNSISDNISHNMSNSNLEVAENKIGTTRLTNNSIGENTIEKIQHQNRNTTDLVFNTSYDFLQDSQLEEDVDVHLNNSIPTQTFSHSAYSNNGQMDDTILKVLSTNTMGSNSYKEVKLNNSENIVNVSNSNSWTEKPEINWQNRTDLGDINNLPKENWSMAQMINSCTNSNWLHKTNSSANGLVHNGYTENLNELLQKSLVFNKQESTMNSNNAPCFQNNFGQQLAEHNIGHYTNSNSSYGQSQSSDFNKKSASFNPKVAYTGYTEGPSLNYHQGNSYVYNNPSYKTMNDDFSRVSRQT